MGTAANVQGGTAPDTALDTEVLIVGGGLVGLSLAVALAHGGIEVILVDREDPAAQLDQGFDGRSSAIARGSQQALAGVGLWGHLMDHAEPILDIRVSDGRVGRPASPLFLHYDHRDLGDPGDLASLPAPGRATAGATGADAPPDDDERQELCRIVDELYAAQLITATGGNVSVRRRGHADEAWITPSQLFKGDLAPEILVRIGMDGKALDEGTRSPSSPPSDAEGKTMPSFS